MVVQIGTGTEDLNQLLMMLLEMKRQRMKDEGDSRRMGLEENKIKFEMSINMAKARGLEPGSPEFDAFMQSRHPEMYPGGASADKPKPEPSAFDNLMRDVTYGDNSALTAVPKSIAGRGFLGIANMMSGGHMNEWVEREKKLNNDPANAGRILSTMAKRVQKDKSLKTDEDKLARIAADVREMGGSQIENVNPGMYDTMVSNLGIEEDVASDRARASRENALALGVRPEVIEQELEGKNYKGAMAELLRAMKGMR